MVHVGDSRCYLKRGQELGQLTRDHTVAQAFVDAGRMAAPAAEESPLNNTLWNVVGGATRELEPEVYNAELSVGDTLLLCTDGLTKHLPDETIAMVLDKEQSAARSCRELVELANAAGGRDNITVLIARFADHLTPARTQTLDVACQGAAAKAERKQLDVTSGSPATSEPPVRPTSQVRGVFALGNGESLELV